MGSVGDVSHLDGRGVRLQLPRALLDGHRWANLHELPDAQVTSVRRLAMGRAANHKPRKAVVTEVIVALGL